MGKVKFSFAISEIRNKVGNVVYSKNRYGNYVRDYKIPFNPQSSSQQSKRVYFGNLSTAWSTLTESERQQWCTIASGLKKHDIFGNQYSSIGFNFYIQINQELFIGGIAAISTPPALEALPDMGVPTATLNIGASEFIFDCTNSVLFSTHAFIIKTTGLVSQGTNFFKNSLTFLSRIDDPSDFPVNVYSNWLSKYGTYGFSNRIGWEVYAISKTTGLRNRGVIGFVNNNITYDNDALLYFAACPTKPSMQVKSYINNLIVSLKSGSNNWSKLKRLWLLCSEFENNWAISIIGPSTAPAIPVNNPVWSAFSGVQYSSSKYINWGFNCVSEGLSTSTSFFASYYQNDSNGFYVDNAGSNAVDKYIQMDARDSNIFNGTIGESGNAAVANTSAFSLQSMKLNGGFVELWNRDTMLISQGRPFVGYPGYSLYGGARNDAGTTVLDISPRKISANIIGEDINVAELYTSIQAYMVSMGAAV